MIIRTAAIKDYNTLSGMDKHVPRNILKQKIDNGEILVAVTDENIIGWLRFSYFWDEIPIMNMLYLLEPYRKMGHGKRLVLHWENKMKKIGHKYLLTTTLSNEDAQHFYRKLGYIDIGGFVLPSEPLELILLKEL